MTRRRVAMTFAILTLLGLLAWYLQPERRLRRTWHRLIEAVEARQARSVGGFLTETYHDRWGYTRSSLIDEARLAFHQIHVLDIRPEYPEIRIERDRATLTVRLQVELQGTPRTAEARRAVLALEEPFQFAWRREDSFPWRWRLDSFDQPELDLTRFRRRMLGDY